MFIKKGVTFVLTSGAYSDYSVYTLCKAKVDLDVDVLRSEYMALNPEQNREYNFEISAFIKWLVVDKNVAKELEYTEWHLGSYGTADFSINENVPNNA